MGLERRVRISSILERWIGIGDIKDAQNVLRISLRMPGQDSLRLFIRSISFFAAVQPT